MSEKTYEINSRLSDLIKRNAHFFERFFNTPLDRKNWEKKHYVWHVERLEEEIKSKNERFDEQKKQIWSLTCSRNYWRSRARRKK